MEEIKMAKKKTSKKRIKSFWDIPIVEIKNREGITPFDHTVHLRNKKLVAESLWECIVENDIEAFKDILYGHLSVRNKENLARKAGFSKRTLFRMLSPSGNPTLKNIAKIIHQICA
jgi:probable addiction module antidote protein